MSLSPIAPRRTSSRPSVAAIVPMRHSSERVQGKNYRALGGKPLYQHVMESLSQVDEIDIIVIDTDSPTIRDHANAHFPQVLVLDRPEHLRDGTIPMNEVLHHTSGQLKVDHILQTHSTNPFVSAATFSDAIRAFQSGRSEHDSLFSVSRLHARLWDENVKPLNHDPDLLLRTQDIPPLFVENSCFFIFDRAEFIRTRRRIGSAPIMFEMSAIESIDIDTEDEWELAVAIAASSSRTRVRAT